MTARRTRGIRFSGEEWRELCRRAEESCFPSTAAYVRACHFGAEPIRPGRRPRLPADTLSKAQRRVARIVADENFRENLDRQVSIRFAESQWAVVEKRAADLLLPPRRYVRSAALGLRLSGRVNRQALRQLAGAASNLNQLARWANTTRRAPSHERLERVLGRVEEAIDCLL